MSKTKDHYGAPAGRGTWRNASRARPCPVCSHDSWCSIRTDGAMVACRRDTSGHPRRDAAGVDYWLHTLERPGDAWEPETPGPAADPAAERAPLEVLDAAYRGLLADLRLSDEHAAGLRGRGLGDDEIRARGYRTLPLEGRAALARAIVSRVGEGAAAGVPGVVVASEGGRSWWTLAGAPGLLVPVRDPAGRVVALKIRRDGADDGPRYVYLSGSQRGGVSALLSVHVPLWTCGAAREVVRVTEGELKADVATALSGCLTISVPGVGAWRTALPALATLGARRVRVAFDADCRVNAHVAASLRALCTALRTAGYPVRVESWDPRFKGVDDYLLVRAAEQGAA